MASSQSRHRSQDRSSTSEDGIQLVAVSYPARRARPVRQQQPSSPTKDDTTSGQEANGGRNPGLISTASSSSGTRRGSSGGLNVKLDQYKLQDRPSSGSSKVDQQNVLPLPVLNSSPSPRPGSPTLPLSTNGVIRSGQKTIRFLQGPSPPRPLPSIGNGLSLSITVPSSKHSVNPDLWWSRTYLSRFRRAFPPGSYRHGALLAVFFAAWIIAFAFLVRANSFLSATVPSDGTSVQTLGCTDTFVSANDGCGLNLEDCSNSGSLTFRCPAGCASQLIYNQRAVGNLEPDMVPFVVGAGQYRADSFICSSYVHSGLVSNTYGGCGVVNILNNVTSFPASLANGIQSLAFPTVYPLAFEFASVGSRHCRDLRWEILGFNVGMGILFSLFLDPGPLVFLWTLFCVSYWHVILVSDPRAYPPVISDAFQDFLPALFVGYYFWRVAFRFSLPSFQSHALERTVWYLAPFWCGVLLNIITEKIQIDRLGGTDITGKAIGTFTALIIVIVILAGWQISVMWRTGWLPFYFRWTLAGGLVILVLSQLPDLIFRLHHYVFALLFMPALGFATRVSAVLQGLLLGIFANGVGKYGWESVLETAAELRRDAALGSDLPSLVTNASNWGGAAGEVFSRAALVWKGVPVELESQWNGFSLLVDDVERYTGTATNYSLASFDNTLPHFFRLAYQLDGTSGDYIKAATWWPNGTWVDPEPGPS